jgi:hypothetical protein
LKQSETELYIPWRLALLIAEQLFYARRHIMEDILNSTFNSSSLANGSGPLSSSTLAGFQDEDLLSSARSSADGVGVQFEQRLPFERLTNDSIQIVPMEVHSQDSVFLRRDSLPQELTSGQRELSNDAIPSNSDQDSLIGLNRIEPLVNVLPRPIPIPVPIIRLPIIPGETPSTFRNSLGPGDTEDTYSVRMTSQGNFNASLTNITAGRDVDIRLFRDSNSNGRLDASDALVTGSYFGSNHDEAINVRNLGAGSYFVQTYLYSGSSSNYTLRMSNDFPSDLLPTEVNAGTLSGNPYQTGGSVSTNDAADTFRFTMGSTGNFNASLTGIQSGRDVDMRLIRDANNNGIVDSGEVMVSSTYGSNRDEAINVRNLGAGSYILQTYLYSGSSSNYTLRMSNDFPSDLLPTEVNAGTLSGNPYQTGGSVSTNDAADTFRFTMGSTGNFNASLTGIQSGRDVDMRLIRDANNNGIVDSGEVMVSSTYGSNRDEAINVRNLGAGSYILQTYLYSGSSSNYTLRMSNDFPSNLLPTEVNAGTLSGNPYQTGGSVSTNDAADTFRFTMGSTGNFNASLTGIQSGRDVDMRLIRDANNNGIVDSGEVMVSSTYGSNRDEAINVRNLGAGSYILQTYLYSGSSSNYTLRMSNDFPSDLLPTEVNAGTIGSTPSSFTNSVSTNDAADVFQFTLGGTSNINLVLSDMSADADLRLVRDSNNNGMVDAGEVIASSTRGGSASEWISRTLGAGNYFAQVYQYSGNTSYDLDLFRVTDFGIGNLLQSASSDSQLNRNEMIGVLRSSKDGNYISSTELSDMRTLVNTLQPVMPDYVHNLADKVVSSDPANQWWTGGASSRTSLGNLAVGASANHMEKLVGKWFLGLDRPAAASGTDYEYVNGSLFQGGISPDDVAQGGLGDCWYVAALASAAHDKPSSISDMFIDNQDGTYTVRFYRDGVADYVTVDRFLPTSSGSAYYAGWNGGSYSESNNELWVALAEKAYAQINESGWLQRGGSNDGINSFSALSGGRSFIPMQHITGLTASNPGTSVSKADMIARVNSDNLVCFGRQGHAYAVTNYDSITGRFHLHNPHGHSHLDLTWEQLVASASTGWHYTAT